MTCLSDLVRTLARCGQRGARAVMLSPTRNPNRDGTRKAQRWRSPPDAVSIDRSPRADNDLAGYLNAPLTALDDRDHRPARCETDKSGMPS